MTTTNIFINRINYLVIKMLITAVTLCLFTLSCQNSIQIDSYVLSIKAGNGSVIKSPNKNAYENGDQITLIAVPNTGYIFVNWIGDISSTKDTITLIMNSNKIIKAIIKAKETDSVIDIEGNIYHTIRIGNQIWSVENLRTTKYNDGTPITLATDSASWVNDSTEKYCFQNNTTNLDSIKKYGALYNWYAVSTKKLAPVGWHVPTSAEWDTLQNYLIKNGYNWDETTDSNRIAKSLAAQYGWDESFITKQGGIGNDMTTNNASGFTAFPGGCRFFDGHFSTIGSMCTWWSSTAKDTTFAYTRLLSSFSEVLLPLYNYKIEGFSVKFLKDN